MNDEKLKDKVFTIPNFLSTFRAFLLPFFVEFTDSYSKNLPSIKYYSLLILLCILVVISDFLDGYLARVLKEESILGRYLDPVSDKIVTIGGLSTITVYFNFPLWILLLYILRELFGVWVGLYLYFKKGILGKPNIWGKTQVTLVAVCVLQYLTMPIFPEIFPNFLINLPAISGYILISVVFFGSIVYLKSFWDTIRN
ncbi:MAG: CDP-alcohol phosphatidyltransferase family protein [Leptospiraceae bacterium]|nr:CDP-alcohol phosphatidyltransferase family protein [Leptospiraceae bacterium]